MQNNVQARRGRESSGHNPPEDRAPVATRYSRPARKGADAKAFSDKLARDRTFVAEPTD